MWLLLFRRRRCPRDMRKREASGRHRRSEEKGASLSRRFFMQLAPQLLLSCPSNTADACKVEAYGVKAWQCQAMHPARAIANAHRARLRSEAARLPRGACSRPDLLCSQGQPRKRRTSEKSKTTQSLSKKSHAAVGPTVCRKRPPTSPARSDEAATSHSHKFSHKERHDEASRNAHKSRSSGKRLKLEPRTLQAWRSIPTHDTSRALPAKGLNVRMCARCIVAWRRAGEQREWHGRSRARASARVHQASIARRGAAPDLPRWI